MPALRTSLRLSRRQSSLRPRDLRSWQNLPLSEIANFKPAVVQDTSESALLGRRPYRNFPLVENGELKGIVMRREIELAAK